MAAAQERETMKFQPGDDVLVTFDGHESRGEYIAQRQGFHECRIAIDPIADYGRKTPALGLYSIVYVRAEDIRPA